MKRFLPLLFLLGCDPQTPSQRQEQCLKLEQTTMGDDFEIAYGPRKCFRVVVVCLRGVQYYMFSNNEGKIGSPALKDDGKPYTCRK